MGKCKKRTLSNKSYTDNELFFATRQDAVNNIIDLLYEKAQKNNKKDLKKQNYKQAISIITMFGITAEELSEAGASYEDLLGLGSVIR